MAAIAGILIAARIGSGDPQSGANFTLLSVTAVVLGGTSVFGGRGTAVGVLVAAALLMILQNAMSHLHISAYWQYVDSTSKCNIRIDSEKYLIRCFHAKAFSRSVI